MDEVVIRIEGPRNPPGSTAAEKVATFVYEALEQAADETAQIAVETPESIDEGYIGIIVQVDPDFDPEELI